MFSGHKNEEQEKKKYIIIELQTSKSHFYYRVTDLRSLANKVNYRVASLLKKMLMIRNKKISFIDLRFKKTFNAKYLFQHQKYNVCHKIM